VDQQNQENLNNESVNINERVSERSLKKKFLQKDDENEEHEEGQEEHHDVEEIAYDMEMI